MDKLGKVFMLDDDLIILNLYQNMLENLGYQVFATGNAYQFLMYAKEIVPDVAVLDINMPGTSGWEVLQRMRNEDKLKQIPVVIMSIAADRSMASEQSVAHYIKKPNEVQDLLEIVESYCVGNKVPDVLLIDDYVPMSPSLKDLIKSKKWSCFEINDIGAAKVYLQKNSPRVVAINLPQDRYEKAVMELNYPRIFYLRSTDYIDALESYLK